MAPMVSAPVLLAEPVARASGWWLAGLLALAGMALVSCVGMAVLWWRARQQLAAARQTLAAAQQAEAFLRQVADALPARLSYWDRDNRCGFANRGFCEWHGMAADNILGRRIADLPEPWRQRAEANAPHVQAVLQGEARRFERDDFDPQGRPCVSLAHYMPDWRAGQVVGFVVLSTDLSAEKAVERRLRALNEQVGAARDRAEAATRAKSVFLANISHEFRTPLNAVLGFTALLRRDLAAGTTRAQQGHLRQVGDAARHLLALVNDLIDLSRMEAGQMRLALEDTDPQQLLQRAVDLMQARAQEKGLALHLQAQGLPPLLRTDPQRLTQALLNLLGNALKFTDQGSVVVHASVCHSAEGRCLRVEVTDTGPGIAPGAQDLLFQPFSQVDGSLTRRHGGSGLGLSITRELLALLGGTVGVVSQPGQGACFWLMLPLPPAVLPADCPGPQAPGPGASG